MLASLLVTAALAAAPADTACITMNTERLPLAQRKSPLDSVSLNVGATRAKVCYGRPSANGRVIFGELILFGQVWRTGANEPTMIHTTGPLTIAGIAVPAGTYSLYTVPGENEWEIIVNRSVSQWGRENYYTDEVKKSEIGHGKVKPQRTDAPVERFTIRAEPAQGADGAFVLEWEQTRVRVPVRAGK